MGSEMGDRIEAKSSVGKPEEELGNGEAGINADPVIGPSPPRARVTDDVEDLDEVDGDDEDGYDSAVEKMGSSSTPSVVEEPQAPKAAEVRMSFAQALQKGAVEEENNDGSKADEASRSRSSPVEAGAEDDGALSSQVSIRAMPIAKLSAESEEQEEEGDVDDEEDDEEEDMDNDEEYEEANDQVLGEEDDASTGTQDGDALPRIIARETAVDQFDLADAQTSSASIALPYRAHDRVEESITTEASGTDLFQATSRLAEPEPVDTGVKKHVAPEVVPLGVAGAGNGSKESEGEVNGQEETEPTRGASSSLLEELQKLSASRSLREQSSISEEAKAANPSETESPDEPSQSAGSEPVSVAESKFSASNSLLHELKKLSDARIQREASEGSTVAGYSTSDGQKVVNVGAGVTKESLDELKELTYGFHMYGRAESEASDRQVAQAASSEEKGDAALHVTEKLSPQAAEVQIMEGNRSIEGGADSATAKDLSEDEEGLAKLHMALNALDGKPELKSENGSVAGTENVQVKPRGFSVADFARDSDADSEDDDDENDDDDDEDQDETDLHTAKALAELANAVGKSGNGAESGTKPSMGAAGPSLPSLPQRPALRKSAAASAMDTAGRITQRPAVTSSNQLTTTDENSNGESAEGNETREKLQNIRVKFLRLAHRLGQSPLNVVVAQVLYRLGLAESLRGGNPPNRTGAFSFDRANALAAEQEAANEEEELDFACTILVLGKTGVGKSATINSIFDDRKSVTSAFKPATSRVQEIVGTVLGIKVRVIDTPGLLPSVADQQHNERIMGQVKKHIKKASPDIVLYFDRLDMQSRDYGDLPLLRTITDLFGAPVWFNAIVVLTHASSAPPDGPNGVPLSYDMFVAQRSHVVQQTIRQAAGDMRLMNPVSLVENHPACRTNRNGQRVLPNGHL